MGDRFAEIVTSGPLVLGVVVAAVAGLISFLSPCILPLVPGYVAYVTGLSGADLADARAARGRVLAGVTLFIAGFGAVFVTVGVVAASVGSVLRQHERVLEVVGGALIVAFGLALLGLVPGLQREVRLRRLPTAGVAGAPVFGAVFALSWIPCIGPTIGAVLALSTVGGQSGRAAVLAAAYTVGLGLPFLLFGLGFRRVIGAVTVIRRHSRWVTWIGAALLIMVGLALLTGAWGDFVTWLRATVGVGEVSV